MNRYLLTLGARLPHIRKELGLTQQEMADLVGVSRITIHKMEKDPMMMTQLFAQSMFQAIAYAVGSHERIVKEFRMELDGDLCNAADTVRGLGKASGLGEPLVQAMAIDMLGKEPVLAPEWTILDALALRHRVLAEMTNREAGLLAMFQVSAFDPIEFGDAVRAGADNAVELLWEGV